MTVNCGKSCRTCALRNPKLRCHRHKMRMAQAPALQPGDVNRLFDSFVDKWGTKYNATVHSTSPHIVTLDNFVQDDEIEAIIGSVNHLFSRSTDQGALDENGVQAQVVSTGRTSENAWCTRNCENHPKTQQLLRRISEVTQVAVPNFESLQVLRYQKGQFYRAHHDLAGDDNHKACGPRIYTFFLYLSDVEEGGATAFPKLNITVRPKKGSALLWPSVTSDNPTQQDPRTLHEAQPVIKGTKFAANTWINLYDYNEPNLWGCTGSFD